MININLIAERRAKRLREMIILRWSSMVVVVVLFAMIGLNVVAGYTSITERNNQIYQKNKLDQMDKDKKVYDATLTELDKIKPHILLIKQVRVSEAVWMIILADISKISAAYPGITITNITANSTDKGVDIRMAGSAPDEKTLGEYMVSLSKTDWAANEKTKVGTISIEPGPGNTVKSVHFEVTVPVADMKGGDL